MIQELDPDHYGHRRFLVQCSCGETRESLVDNLGCVCKKCLSKIKSRNTTNDWRNPSVREKRIKGNSKPRTVEVSQETRAKISATLLGRKVPPEVIERIRKTHRERFESGLYKATRQKTHKSPTLETKAKIAASLSGRKRPQVVSDKVSSSVKLKWQDPEYRARVLEARKTCPNTLERAVAVELKPLGLSLLVTEASGFTTGMDHITLTFVSQDQNFLLRSGVTTGMQMKTPMSW